MDTIKIVITDCSWGSCDVERRNLPPEAQVVCGQLRTEEEVIETCQDAVAAMSEYAPFTRRVMERLPGLKIISNSAMGVDNIDLEAARELGIAVANVPDYCFDEVAEHAMALILSALRNICGYNEKVTQEKKWDFSDGPRLYRIRGSVLGMIGCGQIPRRVAVMAQGFGMHLVGYDPYLPAETARQYGIRMVDTIEALAAEADVVLSHVPLLPSTEKLVGRNLFAHVQKHPVFVNTSRGGTVDHAALCEALRQGRVRAAALDVVDAEPADFTSEIFSFDNVIFTPHAAFYSETALEEVRRRSAGNIVHFLAGAWDKVNLVVRPERGR